MKLWRCLGNVAHQSDHRPVCSIEHARSTTEEGGELHFSQIGATSFSDRSYISLESELFWRSSLTSADSLPWLVLAHVHLIWKWSGLTSGCKWIGTGSQILFVQTPAHQINNLSQLLLSCWDEKWTKGQFQILERSEERIFTKIEASICAFTDIISISFQVPAPPFSDWWSFYETKKNCTFLSTNQ